MLGTWYYRGHTHDVVRVILVPRVVVRGGRSEQVCYYGIRGRIQLWGWGYILPSQYSTTETTGTASHCIIRYWGDVLIVLVPVPVRYCTLPCAIVGQRDPLYK